MHHGGGEGEEHPKQSWMERSHAAFNERFERMLVFYDRWVQKTLDRPKLVVWGFLGIFALEPWRSILSWGFRFFLALTQDNS